MERINLSRVFREFDKSLFVVGFCDRYFFECFFWVLKNCNDGGEVYGGLGGVFLN